MSAVAELLPNGQSERDMWPGELYIAACLLLRPQLMFVCDADIDSCGCINQTCTHTSMLPSHHQMMRVSVLCLLFLVSLVELVHCQQTFPYVSHGGMNLTDHYYLEFTQVGTSNGDINNILCHTDLSTCCSGAQGAHRGDWYFPDGDRLPFPDGSDIIESRQAQRVVLRRTSSTVMGPTGIYRCDIETVAVNGNGMRETVYVGLYTSDGGKLIVGANSE